MPGRKTKDKTAAVATRSSARIIERNSSPSANAQGAVATRTLVKRKAAAAPASTPAAKRGRPSKKGKVEDPDKKVYGYLYAFKLIDMKARKSGSPEQKKAQRNLMNRCKLYQERLAKAVADRTIDLKKLRKIDKTGGLEYEVVELLNSRTDHGTVEFLVLYEDFPLEDCTWEEMSQVDLVPIQSFYKLFPGKPGKDIADKEIAKRIQAAEESEKEEKKGKGKTKPQVMLSKGKAKKTGVPAKAASVSASEQEEENEKEAEASGSDSGSVSGSDSGSASGSGSGSDDEGAEAQLVVEA